MVVKNIKLGSDFTLTGVGIAVGTSEAICGASKSELLVQQSVSARSALLSQQSQDAAEQKGGVLNVMLTAGLKVKPMSGVTFYAQAIFRMTGSPATPIESLQ